MSSIPTASAVKKPTESELEILQVLWDLGPSTVRQVHDVLSQQRSMGYTTVLKLLQIMTTKNLVQRNEEERAHVYEARVPAEQTRSQIAGDMLQRVFEGSASQLMMHALAGQQVSGEELDELRRLIDGFDETGDPKVADISDVSASSPSRDEESR